ncbi:uncharacterized protein BJ212DRAFT_1296730 [Suillus subaureus]|uniref:Uncharacterized protein n=1 Tax=Suillus subaureus TaxID=48587 RepID=A0A9P7JHE8_9AGAM|nr:uncharacterized protein BJ212DRAFT_1296730 [Suillus subaureus]KAG1822762.1 hypothetical protein BJ212DRAFT_1296730 [Suillus subaureus]
MTFWSENTAQISSNIRKLDMQSVILQYEEHNQSLQCNNANALTSLDKNHHKEVVELQNNMAKAQNEAHTEIGQKEARFEHEMRLAKDRFLADKEAELICLNASYSSKIDSLNVLTISQSQIQHANTLSPTSPPAWQHLVGKKPVATCTNIIGFAPIPDISSESDADEEPQMTSNGLPLTSLLGDVPIVHVTVGMLAEVLAKVLQIPHTSSPQGPHSGHKLLKPPVENFTNNQCQDNKANIRELFKTTFHATKDEEYMLHVPVLHKAILSFADETGPGPDPLALQWDMVTTHKSKWNQKVINFLFNATSVGGKLSLSALVMVLVRPCNKWEIDLWIRQMSDCGLLGFSLTGQWNATGKDDQVVWAYLQSMMENLGKDGMSSDMNFGHEMQIIDQQHLMGATIFTPCGSKPAKCFCNANQDSSHNAIEDLPTAFYDPTWLTEQSQYCMSENMGRPIIINMDGLISQMHSQEFHHNCSERSVPRTVPSENNPCFIPSKMYCAADITGTPNDHLTFLGFHNMPAHNIIHLYAQYCSLQCCIDPLMCSDGCNTFIAGGVGPSVWVKVYTMGCSHFVASTYNYCNFTMVLHLNFILGCIQYFISQLPILTSTNNNFPVLGTTSCDLKQVNIIKIMFNRISHLCNGKLDKLPLQSKKFFKFMQQSQDFVSQTDQSQVSKTDFPGSLGPSKATYVKLLWYIPMLHIDEAVAKAKLPPHGFNQLDNKSDVFLKCKADAQLGPFAIKCVTLYEPCNSKVFIWSLPVEILITTIALLGALDLHLVTQVSSLLREIAMLLFFLDRNFPTSLQDLFHICVDSPNFDILSTWRQMDTFHLPHMVLSWLDLDLQSSQLSAFSHFLESIPCKLIQYITLFWNFNILTSPILSQIVRLLENICASSVKELTCMGFCDDAVSPSVTGLAQIQACVGLNTLKAFDASSWTFFSLKLLPFTIQTICLSQCLEKLQLSSVKLSSAQWDKPLCHFVIPMLVELRVNGDYCDSIGHLVLSLPNGHSSAAMMCLLGAHSMVHIKHLVIDYSDGLVPSAPGDPLALSMAWIQALPQVKCVTLRGYLATAAGDLLDIMCSFAAGNVELAVDLHVSPDLAPCLIELCTRCCKVGGDGVPGNPGGKEVPTTQKTIHLLQDANLPSLSEHEASVLHLAHQQLEPNTSQVDNLAAKLFAIMLTDNDANPDSHSKLWNSHSEVQQDKGKVYHSLDSIARFTEDDVQ